MRSTVLLCALAILLSGCADWKTKAAANQDAEDDAKCQSSGGKPDDPAYVQCREQLDAARTRAAGTADEFARKCSGPSTLPPCPPAD